MEPRENPQINRLSGSPEFFADTGEVHFAVVNGGLAAAPPSHGVLFPFLSIEGIETQINPFPPLKP